MLTKTDRLLIEAFKNMLDDKVQLGLNFDNAATDDNNPQSRGPGYLHEHINDLFRLKSVDLDHSTGISAAFSKVHSYKYIDDPTFSIAMDKEMTAQGIPTMERKKALTFIESIIKDMKSDFDVWAEQDFGFNRNITEIIDVTNPDSTNAS